MSNKVALHHHSSYQYDRPVVIGPQVIRLRPAPHTRTPIESYSLRITPEKHFINWQQDLHGNFLARIVFEEKAPRFTVDVDLVANLTPINPFDFFVEGYAESHPFKYKAEDEAGLKPYLATEPLGDRLKAFLQTIDHGYDRSIGFLVAINKRLENQIDYVVGMEPGVQSCEQTLAKGSGSCRDSAWLLIQTLRHLGLAARFTSGYLIQLTPDGKSQDRPPGPEVDLHAWAEVFLPGAGWVGLDPTGGLFAGEGHIPLAATSTISAAAPISGTVEECEPEFHYEMSVERIDEEPGVAKPYAQQQWQAIEQHGKQVDQTLSNKGRK